MTLKKRSTRLSLQSVVNVQKVKVADFVSSKKIKVGHLSAIFALGGNDLNKPILKSSKAQGFQRVGVVK